MNLFLISDTHFSHANIIKYCSRPFTDVEEMNWTIVDRWNTIVKPSDHVYHLGDVAIRREALKIVKALNGHKRLLFGNHDIYDYKSYTEVGFKKLAGIRVLDGILMTHIPVHPDSQGRFKANVHGHVHEKSYPDPFYINVSVEVINYTPIAFEDVKKRIRDACGSALTA